MDVDWTAMILLLYCLCGLGFTIQGFFALSKWLKQRKTPTSSAE
jgi:hypothetical protein